RVSTPSTAVTVPPYEPHRPRDGDRWSAVPARRARRAYDRSSRCGRGVHMEAVEVTLDAQSARQVRAVWWVFFLLGLATVALGILVIVRPITGAFGLAVLIAATLIVSGIG